jgi:hypothetical protein
MDQSSLESLHMFPNSDNPETSFSGWDASCSSSSNNNQTMVNMDSSFPVDALLLCGISKGKESLKQLRLSDIVLLYAPFETIFH